MAKNLEEKIEIIKKIIDKTSIPICLYKNTILYYNDSFKKFLEKIDYDINKEIEILINKNNEKTVENYSDYKIIIEEIILDEKYYIVQIDFNKEENQDYQLFNSKPIIKINQNGIIVYKNQAASYIFDIKEKNINNLVNVSLIKKSIDDGNLTTIINYKEKTFQLNIFPTEDFYLLYFIDITEKSITEKKFKILEKAFNSIHEGIIITDKENKIIMTNTMFSKITGYREEEVIGKNPSFQSSGKHDKDFYIKLWESLYRDGFWEGNIWNRKKDGSIYLARYTISTIKNENNIEYFVAIFEDITELSNSKNSVEFIMNHDYLTGLFNRSAFEDKTYELLENLKPNRKVALILVNIKGFRKINTILGHVIGDFVLIEISNKLKNIFKENIIGRYNADVFSILLEYDEQLKDRIKIDVQKIIDAFKEPLLIKNKEIFVNVNIGVSIYPEDANNIYKLLQNAEESLYKSKIDGLNFYIYSSIDKRDEELYNLENFLRKALKDELFELYYQPQINSITDSVYGAEILLRLRDKDGNYISPAKFIPVAEKIGIIIDIGEWIFDKAFKTFYEWFYLKCYNPINISINLSPRQFNDPNLLGMIERKLRMINIETKYITIEITEGVAVDNIKNVIEKINYLKSLSFSLAIDDFGTGYSSLAYIKKLPLEKIKIDQSFIKELPASKEDFAIVVAIINLASNLRLDIIAEGVETKEQVELLKRLGCYIIQGYYYSKPLPSTEFEKLYLEKIEQAEEIN